MANSTRLTNLEVTGKSISKGLSKSTYTVTATNGAAAAGEAPTKAEFDAVVTLCNELKTKLNKLVSQLSTGSDT